MFKTQNNISYTKSDLFNTDHLKANLKSRAVKGGGITVISRGAMFCIHLLSTTILARLLTPDDFGLFAMVAAIAGIFVIFRDSGLTDATIQRTDISHNLISTIFWVNLAVSAVMSLVLIALSPLVAWFYAEPKLKLITIIWSSNLIISALSAQHIALLKRRMLFFQVSLNEIVAIFISNIAAIILAAYGWSYWALVARPIALVIAMSIGAWVILPWRPGLPAHSFGLRSMLTFGRNMVGYYLINYLASNIDKILIGWRFGAKQLGYYNRAFYLFLLPTTQLTESLKNVAVATLSKLREQPTKYHRYYLNAISVMSFVGMPISFFLMVGSKDLVLLILGPQWGKTAELFQILAACISVRIIYSTLYWIHASLERTDRLIRWGTFALFMNIVAILVGLNFGAKGVAIAFTLNTYLMAGFGLKYACEPIGLELKIIVSTIWRYFIAALIAGLLSWSIIQHFDFTWTHLAQLIVLLFLYTGLYLSLVVLFHKGIKPIGDIVSVIKEMFPKPLVQRSKS